jgi:isopropylmalate/homocitrate/citramalate synthase
MYPKCAQSFRIWVSKNNKFFKIYNELGKPVPFDVTLRDGLQGLDKESQYNFSMVDKMNLYYDIFFNYKPKNIEVGSISSEKVLPIFKDTLEIFNTIYNYQKSIYQSKKDNKQNIYILIPNHEKMKSVINNIDINHFSFITSVSNSFQYKNNKMTIEESYKDIYNMLDDKFLFYDFLKKIIIY